MPITQREAEGGVPSEELAIDPPVSVRVLKAGHGKISTGRHDPRGGDLLYEQGDTFVVAQSIAVDLEDRHFVEIGKEAKELPDPVNPVVSVEEMTAAKVEADK